MKLFRKLISVILTVLILCTSVAFATDEPVSNFEPGEHIEAIAFLRGLNLVDEEFVSDKASRIVTRGEFAKVISDIMYITPSSSFDAVFSDVSYDHPYAPYIYAVRAVGYMNGTSDATFSPDEPIMYEQAVSVCIRITGYSPVAATYGSYPEGYLAQASRIGILENINSNVGVPISRGNLVELIYNTVLCDIMVVTGYGDNGSYAIYEGENILSHYHKIEEGTGIVTADNHYTMTSEHSGYADAVIINGQKYYKKDADVLADSVGRNVKFWYLSNGNTKTILYSEKYETGEIIFGVRDGLEFDITRGEYKFYDKNKSYVYKLSNSYDVIYNMEELAPVTESKLLPKTGKVTLIDNDSDNRYDVVIIDEFYNLVTDMYNKNLNVISDINDSSRNLNLDDLESYRILDKGGNELSLDKIKSGSIVEVYKSSSGKHITAIVNSGVVSGKYTEKTYDKIKVDGVEYGFSYDVRSDISSLALGSEYDFYVNANNEIVYWTLGSGYKQAYILDVGEGSGLDKDIFVKFLSQTGNVEVYPLADTVKNMNYSGTASVNKSNWNTIFPEINNREFVLYQLNAKQEISTVVHALKIHDRDTFGSAPSYPLFRLDYFAEKWLEMDGFVYPKIANSTPDNPSKLYFRGGINGFDNMLIFSDDAKLYRVPSVTNPTVEDKNVSVTPVSSTLSTDYTVNFTDNYVGDGGTMITYMVGNTYPYANVMVEHAGGAGASVALDQPGATVTAIKNTYDLNTNEEEYFMEVWNGEKIVKVNLTDETMISRSNFATTSIDGETPVIPASKQKIEVGDIIKYTTDESGYLKSLALMYDNTTKTLCYDTRGFGDEYNLSDGEVARVRSNMIEVKITLENSNTRWEVYNVTELPTLIIDNDRGKDKIYIGSSLDIEVGDEVLRYSRFSGNKCLTVYKH